MCCGGWRKFREHQAAGARKRGDLAGHATAQREADNLFEAIGEVATAENHSIPDAARKDIARSAVGKSAPASSSRSRSEGPASKSESKAAPAESFDTEFDAAEFRLDSDARTAATAASVGSTLRDVYATPKAVARIRRIASYTHTPQATVERVFDQHLALRAGRDLATVAEGGRIPPQRLAKLQELGLVSRGPASGERIGVVGQIPRITAQALPLLPNRAHLTPSPVGNKMGEHFEHPDGRNLVPPIGGIGRVLGKPTLSETNTDIERNARTTIGQNGRGNSTQTLNAAGVVKALHDTALSLDAPFNSDDLHWEQEPQRTDHYKLNGLARELFLSAKSATRHLREEIDALKSGTHGLNDAATFQRYLSLIDEVKQLARNEFMVHRDPSDTRRVVLPESFDISLGILPMQGAAIVEHFVHPSLLPVISGIVNNHDGRAKHSNGVIYINPETHPLIVAHEIIHAIEQQNPQILAACQDFLQKRALRGKDPHPKKLTEITGKSYYSGDEMAYEDAWRELGGTCYSGKIYTAATEILTVGLERLAGDPLTFAVHDPEYFSFVVNTLQGAK